MRQLFMNAFVVFCVLFGLRGTIGICQTESTKSMISKKTTNETIEVLIKTRGESHINRIKKGVSRVASIWWAEDGNEADFTAFCDTF